MFPARLLTKDEFLECFAGPMRDVTATAQAVVDIWPYVESVSPSLRLEGEIRDVTHVYRDARNLLEQVLVNAGDDHLFLVVVVDIAACRVHGHYLLDLAAEYPGA